MVETWRLERDAPRLLVMLGLAITVSSATHMGGTRRGSRCDGCLERERAAGQDGCPRAVRALRNYCEVLVAAVGVKDIIEDIQPHAIDPGS